MTFFELVDKVKADTNVNCHPGADTVIMTALGHLGMGVAEDGMIVQLKPREWVAPEQRNVRYRGQRRRGRR